MKKVTIFSKIKKKNVVRTVVGICLLVCFYMLQLPLMPGVIEGNWVLLPASASNLL